MKTGTVISGTLNTRDIFLVCMDILRRETPRDYYYIRGVIDTYGLHRYSEMLEFSDHPFWDSLPIALILSNEVFDLMGDLAPPGHYFGAHPGDGADLGYWRVEPEELTVTDVLDGIAGYLSGRNKAVDEKELDNLINVLESHTQWLKEGKNDQST